MGGAKAKKRARPVSTLDGVSDRARRLWVAVNKEREFSKAELELLRCACEALDRADDAAAIIKVEGSVVNDRYGRPKAHPAVEVEHRSRTLFASLVKQLNLALDEEPESLTTRRARRAANARWAAEGRRGHR